MASSVAACWPPGGCCAATPGAAAASTRSADARARLRHPGHQPARDRDAARPRLVPRQPRADLGLVDRRDHGGGADAPRAADHPPDPLDAEPAALRAADEGDPAQVQARPAEAERGADALLPGE